MRDLAHFLAVVMVAAPVSAGDWRVVELHPPGAAASEAFGAGGDAVVGHVLMSDGRYHPALWNGPGHPFIDLLPDWAWSGEARGTDGHQHFGRVATDTWTHAPLWFSDGSFVDLLPAGGYSAPRGYDVCGEQQVGYAYSNASGTRHALLWYGTAESFVDLHPPPGAYWSEALATDGVLQGGRVAQLPGSNEIHAILWRGTAESWVDMNPPGSRESRIQGMADGVQVGWGLFFTQTRACLWRGTPESYQDMHPTNDPPGSTSRLYDTTGRYHAGYVEYIGWAEAAVWLSDDPDDFVNLHQLLGPDYYASAAYGISEHEGKLYVAGSSARAGQRERATLWIGRIPDTDRPPRRPPTSTPGQQTKPTSAGPLIP